MADNQNYKPTTFRSTVDQRKALADAASRAGIPTSAWIREICLAAAGASQLAKQMGVARERHEEMLEEKRVARNTKRRKG